LAAAISPSLLDSRFRPVLQPPEQRRDGKNRARGAHFLRTNICFASIFPKPRL
jgi:hypothetical protein